MTTPLLFQDLRSALACLYSLPQNGHHTTAISSKAAHEYLLNIQSRNVRRKLQAIQQSGRDSQSSKSVQEGSSKLVDEVQGSTWLACLAVLSFSNTEFAERLFAAQTLMHRLRRIKLSEAIDLEMEDPNKYLDTMLNVNLSQLAADYAQWMHQFHPLLGTIVQEFLTQRATTNATNEEQLKGELTMLTLATITYLTACHSHDGDASSIQPLLVTLGNCMAATALRLRFTPQSVSRSDTKATPASAPIVTMMVQSLSATATADLTTTTPIQQQTAFFHCLCACLGVVPEAILSSSGGGGAMGRISMDPRCIQAAHDELRQPTTGVYLFLEALKSSVVFDEVWMQSKVLATFQNWAKCLPLPQDFVDYTVPLAGKLLGSSIQHEKMAALSYLIAILESGSVSSQYILQYSLGISSDPTSNHQQTNKKRQSSRSKRRQQERLDTSATDDLRAQAEHECRHRGEMACRTAGTIWKGLAALVREALLQDACNGEGPVGCLCACANACLPHWLRYSSNCSAEDIALALRTMELFQELCSHSDRRVRGLTYEPLYTLNTKLLQCIQVRCNHSPSLPPTEMERIVANHLYQCAMRLATSCGYAADYFDCMERDNDEEVEVERNDVRDMIRAVCGCEGDIARGETSLPRDLSMTILSQIVHSVSQACDAGTGLPPETAVHAISSLAKPLNVLSAAYVSGYRCEGIHDTLLLPVQALGRIHKSTITAFGSVSMKIMFPISRLANLATAAFAPTFSTLCSLSSSSIEIDQRLFRTASETVENAVHAAALSIVHIPELTAESTLDHTQYDIRGAMRSPGGEDHVGCLALMRLVFESDGLARVMLMTKERNADVASLPLKLCTLQTKLKSLEIERGPEVFHGSGVSPKSRRILCQTICHLVLLGSESGRDEEALTVLNNLFVSLVVSVADLVSQPPNGDAETIYRVCEGVLDLAAFSPSMICKIFENTTDETGLICQRFLLGVTQMVELGYPSSTSSFFLSDDTIFQWSRLRGALFALVRASASPDIPAAARTMISLLNLAECQAIKSHFVPENATPCPIFRDAENLLPAGLFVRLLQETIEKQQGERYLSVTNCVATLQDIQGHVLDVLLSEYHAPSNVAFLDPRSTLCEAWFLSLVALISSPSGTKNIAVHSLTKSLLSDSCCSALLLFLYQSIRRDSNHHVPLNVGMPLDGPQTRAILMFLERYFTLGPEMLRSASLSLGSQLMIEITSIDVANDDHTSQGLAILGASLFRAASGGLPPWAIESIPSLYAALFAACGNDTDIFCQMLQSSMDVRLGKESRDFGIISRNELLAGRFIAKAKDSAKADFVKKSREACQENSTNGWRRFKTLLKQACGGKKKSSPSLKPSFTTWDLDRI